MAEDEAVKAWIKAKEALLRLEKKAGIIGRYMEKNATAASNPVRAQQLISINKMIDLANKEVDEVEQLIGKDVLERLQTELDEVRREERKKGNET